jgi:hypothetical protein
LWWIFWTSIFYCSWTSFKVFKWAFSFS